MRIAISGKMTSGKSLMAKHLVNKYGFTELTFAGKVREVADELFIKTSVKKDRLLLLQVGEKLREIDPRVWIRVLMRAIVPGANTVVSDVRFPLEYETLHRLGFFMVRAYIDRSTQVEQVQELYPDMPLVLLEDYSEVALDHHPFDYIITNTKQVSLKEVYAQVDRMVGEIKARV